MRKIIKKIAEFSILGLYRSYQHNNRKKRAASIVQAYLASNASKSLHIGSGGHVMDGWLNIDIDPQSDGVAYMDAGNAFPLPANRFDYIFSEHVIEHLSLAQQENMLAESYRILKPGGCIRIATPNFDFLMHLAAKDKTALEEKYLAWNLKTFIPAIEPDTATPELYVINNYFRDWGHQLIHNRISLSELLQKNGFVNIQPETVGNSNHPALQKLEAHGAMITDEFNLLETMILEAEKPAS